eukprot:TRINITY_DN37438_c0_g1_i1.p1 TRINITY_DN37438_c0_g1~~TRINITY_DN37438_c0_g1_i1.p1  ORF type:complete len:535 (+),score=163.81 TRINITY_DN37438_c0_g1_i1:75-1607(+)
MGTWKPKKAQKSPEASAPRAAQSQSEVSAPRTAQSRSEATTSARPRRPGLGLGAAGALLRAAGALPKRAAGRGEAPARKVAASGEAAAAFLEHCLGGPAAVLDAAIEQAITESETPGEASSGDQIITGNGEEQVDVTFSLGLSDAEDLSEDDADLEDMFDFDPEKLAELMNKGASSAELADHLEVEYAAALERRLMPKEALEDSEALGPQLDMGDLQSLMTPEQVTPVVTPTNASGRRDEDTAVAAEETLQESCHRSQERARRSLAVQHRASAAQRRDSAAQAVEAFGRKSLASMQCLDLQEQQAVVGAVQAAARRSSNRHRRSVTKAVEVLEEVAVASSRPLEKWPEEQVEAKVEVVQEAMAEAYKRHRRSITEAVQNVVSSGSAAAVADASAKDSLVEDRIQQAVAAAYQRQQWDCAEAATESWAEEQWQSFPQQDLWSQQSETGWGAYSEGHGQWGGEHGWLEEAATDSWADSQLWQSYAQEQEAAWKQWGDASKSWLQAPWRYGSA